jgi:hypothetical protein
VDAVHPVDDRPVGVRVGAQRIADVDAFDDQHLAVQLDLAFRVSPETTASGGDAARLERAPEGADQSTGRGGDDVVEGGGVRR